MNRTASLVVTHVVACGLVASAHATLQQTASWSFEPGQANAEVGASVSTAGDVNNDGFSDLLVGAPGWSNGQTEEGRVWLFLGTENGLSATAAWSYEVNQAGAQLGQMVSCAGDVNGDGYDDVLLGAPYYSNGQSKEGRTYCFHGGPSGLSASPDWYREGGVDLAYFGRVGATAGDVNGDGYDDVIVAAPNFGQSTIREGSVYLYLGSPTGLGSTVWSKEGNQTFAELGSSVSTAGDVNGDGRDDVIIGAPGYDTVNDTGAVWIYLGTSAGLASTAVFFVAGASNWRYGQTVATTGDSNGDGYSDVMVKGGFGGPSYVYVYHGRASGTDINEDHIYTKTGNSGFGLGMFTAGDVNGDGYADAVIGNRDENALYLYESMGSYGLSPVAKTTLFGPSGCQNFGLEAATAGDVNGDGYADVVVSDWHFESGAVREGKVWVYHGMANLEAGTTDWEGESGQAYARYGSAVAAGDWNGDGFDDLAVSTPLMDNGQVDEGMAWVHYGGPEGPAEWWDWVRDGNQASARYGADIANAGDVNGDGFEELMVSAVDWDNGQTDEGHVWVYAGSASGLGDATWQLEIDQDQAHFGTSIAAAGDVNGDGFGDVLVGTPSFDSTDGSPVGAAFVYLGSPTGLAAEDAWRYLGEQDLGYFGYSVSSAGDVNADGFSDVIIGAVYADHGQTDEGLAYVFHGSASGLGTAPATTLELNQAFAGFGYSVATAGDVNGDGYSDVIVGAPEYDNGADSEGLALVYLGGPAGVSTTPFWSAEGSLAGARRGTAVAPAGDVNNDGYSDFLVSAPYYSHSYTDEGRAGVSFGAPTPPPGTYTYFIEGGQTQAHLGIALGAGDFNGDGFSDIITGATGHSGGHTREGRVEVHLGNDEGLDRAVRQQRVGDPAPIAVCGTSDALDAVRLSGQARTPMGRGRVRAQWHVQHEGSLPRAFPATDASEYDTGPPVSGIGSRALVTIGSIASLEPDQTYYWHLRFRGDSPYFPWTPWQSMARNGLREADFRTNALVAVMPGLPEASGLAGLSLVPLGANPWRDRLSLGFELPARSPARVTLHDVQGRWIATLANETLEAGTHTLAWDGRTHAGLEVPDGVYFVRLEAGPRSASARIVRLR